MADTVIINYMTDIFFSLQLSPSCAAWMWSRHETDWVKLVYSALNFLSGSSGGMNIVIIMMPYLEFLQTPSAAEFHRIFQTFRRFYSVMRERCINFQECLKEEEYNDNKSRT